MSASLHIDNDKLQELFDALPKPTTGGSFEQETMRRVYLAAQKKLLAEERKKMLESTLLAAAVAACVTVAAVSGLVWISKQQQAAIQLLQEANILQTLKFSAKEYLWVLAVGAFIWLLSVPHKSYRYSY